MRITEILRRKGTDVVTLPPNAPIADAVALLRDRGIGCIVISGPDSSVVGMISERDIARNFGTIAPDAPVSAIMLTNVPTCSLSTDVEDLAGLMTKTHVRHIPVLNDEGNMLGLVSIGDVVKERLAELSSERDHLVKYVQTHRT